jgi:hypothetical protein
VTLVNTFGFGLIVSSPLSARQGSSSRSAIFRTRSAGPVAWAVSLILCPRLAMISWYATPRV